jgi:hypothetical protein
VISTVPSRCVRILGSDGSVSIPSVETQGYDSPFALELPDEEVAVIATIRAKRRG